MEELAVQLVGVLPGFRSSGVMLLKPLGGRSRMVGPSAEAKGDGPEA